MKKFTIVAIIIILLSVFLTGCNAGFDPDREIVVIARDSASGTREAFEEKTGLIVNKVSQLKEGTEELAQTGGVIEKVKADAQAIGYISAGLISDEVKTVKVNGVAPTVTNIANNSYPIQRPFVVVYKEASLTGIVADFEIFLRSKQAQELVAEEGFVKLDGEFAGKTYGAVYAAPAAQSGTIKISGSTSVGPAMEVIKEKYIELNPNITIELTEGGSSVGLSNAKNGTSHFGMMSKALSSSETEVVFTQIAIDGVAIIVNKKNTVENLTVEQIKAIYIKPTEGIETITKWSQVL